MDEGRESKAEPETDTEIQSAGPPRPSLKARETGIPSRQLRIANWGLLVAVLGLIAMILFGILGLRQSVGNLQSEVEEIGKGILEQQFSITRPADGDSVSLIDVVRGTTPFGEKNHYIVVTPIVAGTDFVQPGPLDIHVGGSWVGRATFGAAGLGVGEEFLVRCIGTESSLQEGPLLEVPADAVFSEVITVIRKR